MRLEEIERLPKERLIQQRIPVQQIVKLLNTKVGQYDSDSPIFIGLRRGFRIIVLYCVLLLLLHFNYWIKHIRRPRLR